MNLNISNIYSYSTSTFRCTQIQSVTQREEEVPSEDYLHLKLTSYQCWKSLKARELLVGAICDVDRLASTTIFCNFVGHTYDAIVSSQNKAGGYDDEVLLDCRCRS